MVSSRAGSFGPPLKRTPVVLGTLVLLGVIYVVAGLLLQFAPGFQDLWLGATLITPDVMAGQVWRLLSYGLLHNPSDPFHVVMNGLMLFFFGRDLELRWGRGRFAGFLAAAVLAGGISVVASGLIGLGVGSAIGFSAATEACIVAWALFFRDRQILMFMVMPIKGIWMLALALVNWLLDAASTSSTSAAAHFGGIVFGLLVAADLAGRLRRLRRKRQQARFTVVPKAGDRWVN